MSTAGALITKVEQQLLAGVIEEKNKLATALNTSETSVVLTYDLKGCRAGTVFQIDSELFYVWEANTGTKTLTVQRAYGGSTAASHSAAAIVTSMPRFPRHMMLDALNADLDDLSSPSNGLYRVVSQDITYNGSARQINITSATNVISLLEVKLRYLATDFPILRGVRLQRELPTADFASGFAIVFDVLVRAGTLRVTTSRRFTRVTSESDDLQTVAFLPQSCEDIVEMGVLLRMMNGREIKRNFIESQGDTRRSEEVPAGAVAASTVNVQRLRRDRILAEAARLKAQYPLQFRK